MFFPRPTVPQVFFMGPREIVIISRERIWELLGPWGPDGFQQFQQPTGISRAHGHPMGLWDSHDPWAMAHGMEVSRREGHVTEIMLFKIPSELPQPVSSPAHFMVHFVVEQFKRSPTVRAIQ